MEQANAESPFARRVAAAARAGWWCLLIGVGLVALQTAAYVVVSHSEDLWSRLSCLLGVDTDALRRVVFHFMVTLRLLLVVGLMGCIFLSLWAARLRRVGG